MKNNLGLFCITLLLYCTVSYSQHTITPGVGFDNIQLNMSIDDLVKKIGEPEAILSREEEKEKWEETGYNTKESFPFMFKFDEVYVFRNQNEFAIWKVHVRKNKVVYFNLSSYNHPKEVTEDINVSDNIHFYDNLPTIVAHFGDDYYLVVDKSQNNQYYFLEDGIRFIVNDSELRTISVFTPPKKCKQRRILKKL